MSRSLLAITFVIAIFVVTIVHNDRAAETRNGVVQITYWTGWTGPELQLLKRMIDDEFNRTHPKMHVRVISIGASGSLYQKVRIAFATGAVPDVCSAVWSSELAGYACRGVLEPLDGFMKSSGRSGDEFVPGLWRSLQYNGRAYGLCTTNNTNFLVYNKKVFRECGLDPNRTPRTIEELDKTVAAVTKYDSRGEFIRYGFRPTSLELWAYVFGGKWYDPKTGRVTANDPKNVECLRWLASYSKKYDINKMQTFEASFGNWASVNGSFFTGKQVIMITGDWIEEFVNRYAHNLDWGFFPFPYPPGGRKNFTPVGGSVFVIPKACRHKKEAWEFLSWICSPKPSKEFCLGVTGLSPLVSTLSCPEYQRDPMFRFSTKLSAGKNVMGSVPIPTWAQYQSEIARVEDYAVHGKEDPKKLLDDLTVKMQKELDNVLKGY